MIAFGLYKLRKRLGAMSSGAAAAASSSGGDDLEEEEEEKDAGDAEEIPEDDALIDFLDAGYTKGLDDSDALEINPVMAYKMSQAKKRARAAARAAQLGTTEAEMNAADSSAAGGSGRPGGLARLGWKLTKSGAKEDDRRNMATEVKGIEMFLAREEDIDVKHYDTHSKHMAGENMLKPGVLAVALSSDHKSNIGRVGGRRGSTLAATAQGARQQLQVLKDTKPELFKAASRDESRASCSGDQNYRLSVIKDAQKGSSA